MRIVRGMQKSFRCDNKELNALGWKNSFSHGIGITAPKARTRDKPIIVFKSGKKNWFSALYT